jgi:hypothetical protein
MAAKIAVRDKNTRKSQKKAVLQTPLKDRIEKWCASNRNMITGLIILVSVVFRAGYFLQINSTHLIHRHLWEESDMSFFDQWATIISKGNILSDTVLHPMHGWTREVAARYFSDHPEVYKSLKESPGADSLKNPPSKMLWDQWYGGKQFHQEPLYAYFIAINYALFGHDARIIFIWQMIFGILTNLLIYLVARRYFGDFTATLSVVMAIFCGPVLFFELILLRSSMTVFFGILLVYLIGLAMDKNKPGWWFFSGFVTGLAMLLQVYFVLFLFAMILLLAIKLMQNSRRFIIYPASLIAGTMIALSPAFARNAIVGAPLFSLNSNGASTFITDNNATVVSFAGWNVDNKIMADIMGSSDGHLSRAIIPTLKTHGNLLSYFRQLFGKIHATFSWFEIPNNVNFYFFREHSIALSMTFLNFLILTPLAIAGLFLAILKKKNATPLISMIIVQLIPLLGFLVLSRHRVALIPVLIPFAAFTITDLTGSRRGWKNLTIVAGLVLLTAWSASPHNEFTVRMERVDYESIYIMHYVDPLKKLTDNREWKKAAVVLEDFIDRYEPRTLRNFKPFYRCSTSKEADVYLFFSWIHNIHSQILVPTGDTKSAASESQISSKFNEAASIDPALVK